MSGLCDHIFVKWWMTLSANIEGGFTQLNVRLKDGLEHLDKKPKAATQYLSKKQSV